MNENIRSIFDDNLVIITVGRLTRQKGQWHLIRAFKKVKEVFPESKLIILGEGELEIYLKELVTELNLKNDVLFFHFQKNPFKFMAKAKTTTKKEPKVPKAKTTAKPKAPKAKATPAAKAPAAPTEDVPPGEFIGTVSNYFDRPGVAAIVLEKPLKVGDKIAIKQAEGYVELTVESMQIDLTSVESAAKGQDVGIKVPGKVHQHNKVYKI